MEKQTIIFSPAAYNLAETTRCIEIAKACRELFEVVFISYGGDFEHIIKQEEFKVICLEPQLTPKKVEHLYKVDQGEKFGSFFTKDEIVEQVRNEIHLFEKLKPAAIVTGFNFSSNISCRVSKVPLIWLTHTTWMIESLYKSGSFTYPDLLDIPLLQWLGEKKLTKLALFSFKTFSKLIIKPYNKIAKKYGIEPFKSMEDFWKGDYNLLAEPEDFCNIDVPDTFHYIGPLIAKLDAPVPVEIENMPRDKPILYFAMGSSGQPQIIKEIIEGFKDKPYRIISPSKSKLKGLTVDIPENVIVTDWLPAHKINPLADISVIHGGIGTVMTAALSGKPVVGVGMMSEQEANIDCLVHKGFAVRIRKSRFKPDALIAAINKLLSDENAKGKAREYQKTVEKWMDTTKIIDFFKEHFIIAASLGGGRMFEKKYCEYFLNKVPALKKPVYMLLSLIYLGIWVAAVAFYFHYFDRIVWFAPVASQLVMAIITSIVGYYHIKSSVYYRTKYKESAYQWHFYHFMIPYLVIWYACFFHPLFINGESIMPFGIALSIGIILLSVSLWTGVQIEKAGFKSITHGMDIFSIFPEEATAVYGNIYSYIRPPLYFLLIIGAIAISIIKNNWMSICAVLLIIIPS